MRFVTLAALALILPASVPAQIIISDTEDEAAAPVAQPAPTPRPRPQVTARPSGTLPGPPAGSFLPRNPSIAIEETTVPLRPGVDPDEPITITPAPGAIMRHRPSAPLVPATTEAPPPPPATPAAATGETDPGTDRSFLPVVPTGMTSPTLERGGQTLPLRPEMLEPRPLDLTVPDVNQTTLSNGMRFYHYESQELPRVSFNLLLNAGEQFDPAGKVGLADLTARIMRAGGAGELNADEVDRQLEQLGSDLSIGADREYTSIRMFALQQNAGKALGLLADLITSPTFDAAKLNQQRALALEDVRRENDDPAGVGRREFRKVVYGADNPLARTATSATLNAITRDDVLKFYADYYRPASIMIGVSGAISQADARKLVEETFGDWKLPPAETPPAPTVDEARDTTAGVYLIRRLTAQSQVRLGHLGVPRHSPEQYALAVLNNIYGTGGFSSRLMNVVRTQHGYAYGTGGSIQHDTPRGLFFAAAASKAQTTAAAIRSILEVTGNLSTAEITEDEVETAKRDVIFSFFTNLDSPGEIVGSYMQYDFLGYPKDYLKTYTDRVRAVTPEELRSAARRLIDLNRIKILVVGNDEEFDAPLSEFGPVQELRVDSESGGATSP